MQLKTNLDTKKITITAITAAVYMVATLAIAPIGFGVVQLRLSEIMVLLAFIDKKYSPGLILGCFLANLFSPVGVIDVFFGTAGTIFAVFGISKCKRLLTAGLMPVISMVIVSVGISIGAGIPYLPTLFTVAAEEFAVVICIGCPVMKLVMKNEKLMEFLKNA